MNKIFDLLSRRKQILQRLHERTKARDEALQALRMIDRLEADLPTTLAAISRRSITPYIGDSITREDSVDPELIRDSDAIVTAKGLLAELPQLRRFWESKLKAAMADIGRQAA